MRTVRYGTMRYPNGVPRKALPPEHVVVHNHVQPYLDPERRADGIESMADVTHGMNGFRVWIAAPEDDPRIASYGWLTSAYEVEPCPCDWAPELGVHYRVVAAWQS